MLWMGQGPLRNKLQATEWYNVVVGIYPVVHVVKRGSNHDIASSESLIKNRVASSTLPPSRNADYTL